jgi:class 3 adenylate cyclase
MTHRQVVMFMSADVVGSTEFKTRSAVQASGGWVEAFEAFFNELPLIFMGRIANHFWDVDRLPDSGVWKVMGDELVFAAKPRSIDEARRVAMAFRDAVADYDQSLAQRWPLRIRGACWAAEIGGRNRAVEIPEMLGGRNDRPYVDYLGPDVDIGFRLSPHSRTGRVILSPNLAESLARAAALSGDPEPTLDYQGEAVLKGVCGGHPFPLVLMATPAQAALAEPFEAVAARLALLRERIREATGVEAPPPVFRENHAVA